MDLTTKYLGLELKHPFMPGASPLLDDLDDVRRFEDAGASALVMRSLFEEQVVAEELAMQDSLQTLAGANAEATSYFPDATPFVLGPEEYLEHLRKVKEAVSVPVIGSLNGVTAGNWLEYAKRIEEAGADALELNVYYLASDPEKDGDGIEWLTLEMARAVKTTVRIPVALKLSPYYSSLANFAAEVDKVGLDGLVLFNRFYQPDIDITALEVKSDLELSTSAELRLRLRWLAILSPFVKASLAASGGVHTAEDAVKAVMSGAHAVQLVSSLIDHGPDLLRTVIDGVSTYLERKEYDSLEQMQGSMNLGRAPDSAAFERANYVQILKSWKGYR